jgi:amidase
MASSLWQLSAVQTAQGIRDGDFSASEVLESVLERVADVNPRLNAIVYDCSDEARETAARADRARAAGETLGPLHGVPVTIKINVDQKGTPNSNGLPAFAELMATEDAPIVANLRRAGAVIIGRTNTPELSMRGTTDNPLHGRTLNPWADEATPGGSSGGAAAAAAAGCGMVHHGNDIAGSLRFPSSACGVATVKPGLGRVPAYNPSAPAERGMLAQLMSVQGAICRDAADVRLATAVMAAGDPRDPWWVPVPFEGMESLSPADVKVAVTTESYGYPIHDEIVGLIEQAADVLSDAGYRVERVATPSVAEAAQGWFDVAFYEVKMTLDPIARQHGSDALKNIFDWYYTLGNLVDADGYREGIAERTRMTREWSVFLNEYPLVLSPFLMQPTYGWNYDAGSEANTHDLFRSAIYSAAMNYLGLPAGVLPGGYAGGLPCGIQIIGRRFREDLILDAMTHVESAVGVLTRELWNRESSQA